MSDDLVLELYDVWHCDYGPYVGIPILYPMYGGDDVR
jgi:hypothetical protein